MADYTTSKSELFQTPTTMKEICMIEFCMIVICFMPNPFHFGRESAPIKWVLAVTSNDTGDEPA